MLPPLLLRRLTKNQRVARHAVGMNKCREISQRQPGALRGIWSQAAESGMFTDVPDFDAAEFIDSLVTAEPGRKSGQDASPAQG